MLTKSAHRSFRPYLTIGLCAAAVAFTLIPKILEASLYGQSESNLRDFAFWPGNVFQSGGLSWITSAFVHAGTFHLFVNLVLFLPFAVAIERSSGKAVLASVLAIVHMLVLSLLVALVQSSLLQNPLLRGHQYFGLSHLVFGLVAFWGLRFRKYLLLAVAAGALGYEGFWLSPSQSLLPHALGFGGGLICSLVTDAWRKHRPQNAHR